MNWDDCVKFLKGVGPKRAEKLEKLEIATVGDLLRLFPRGYIDYTSPFTIATAPYNSPCAIKAQVVQKFPMRRISGGRTLFKVLCQDDTAGLELIFFNNPYVADKLQAGVEYIFYGKVGGNFNQREMLAPSFLQSGLNASLAPIYPLTGGLKNHELAKPVENALKTLQDAPEPLPAHILAKYALPGIKTALEMIHLPKSQNEAELGRKRFIFEELFCLQLGMLLMRGGKSTQTGAAMQNADVSPLVKCLPFALTGAQKRAIKEICEDMSKTCPMNRLLQGDVGSGKTMVAAAAIYYAAQNGYQSVLMAPTEILANQHRETLEKCLKPLGVNVVLLTGGIKGKARKEVLQAIASGTAGLVVGTHAVLSQPVNFFNLGLAVTDEQHRFGVRQRGILAQKAQTPHLLVMSATPIPRTLALLMFGDLDLSILDEMPKGRLPIKTRTVEGKRRRDMFGFLEKQINAGHQVYIVCPLIEEGESDLQAACTYADEIARPFLPNAKVGLMHGRLKPQEKAQIMQAFKNKELNVLVSTTVIEVGVDVPNATVMVIEDAERYGLSALHQLRGRVGRSGIESWCFLVSEHGGQAAKERLSYLCKNHDGFEVAKYDLKTRGPGDFFGSRQHGLPTLRIAQLATDTRALHAAQKEAANILLKDPKLEQPEHAPLAQAVQSLFTREAVMN